MFNKFYLETNILRYLSNLETLRRLDTSGRVRATCRLYKGDNFSD